MMEFGSKVEGYCEYLVFKESTRKFNELWVESVLVKVCYNS